MSDTIPFRTYQPKRPWRVSKLGGGCRTFASLVSAANFARQQAALQWAIGLPWMITNTADGRVYVVTEDGPLTQTVWAK